MHVHLGVVEETRSDASATWPAELIWYAASNRPEKRVSPQQLGPGTVA